MKKVPTIVTLEATKVIRLGLKMSTAGKQFTRDKKPYRFRYPRLGTSLFLSSEPDFFPVGSSSATRVP